MLIPRDAAIRFITGYKAILTRVLADADIPRTPSVTNDLTAARTYVKQRPGSIDMAIAQLESDGQAIDASVVSAVKRMKVDQWVYLRHTQTYAIFIDRQVENAYQVRALTTPLNELLDRPPFAFEAGVFEYEGFFVCDGLALNPVALGPGYKAQFTAAYSEIRKAGRLHSRTAA